MHSINNQSTSSFVNLGKKLLDASREGKIDNVKQLTGSGAPFTTDWLGTTSLHLAAKNGHVETARVLLEAGVNLDAKTKLERTALHIAAQEGRVEVTALLLSHGADVNSRDMLKMTPLHWSVERRHTRIVHMLLENGADIEIKSKFLMTPFEIARDGKYQEIVEIFELWTNNRLEKCSSITQTPSFSSSVPSSAIVENDFAINFDSSSPSQNTIPDLNGSCMDLIELEWHSIKLEPDLFLQSQREEERNVEYLMKIVDVLQKENSQLRQRVEQLST